MQRRPCLIFFFFISFFSRAQPALLIGVHTDLIRSDNDGFFEKVQAGFEANYFFSRKFSVTAGVEAWSDDGIHPMMGIRLCPVDEAFLRVRGLIGKDISIGGGFARPVRNNFRIEAMADFYFSGDIAIRAGLAYAIMRGREKRK